MTAPRIEVDLGAIEHNARTLVERLAARGIDVCGVTKATCGSPAVAEAMVAGGVRSLGDARVSNLERLRHLPVPRWLTRSPMLSQAEAVVATCTGSFVSELACVEALGRAATRTGRVHQVVLMVDLGDLREGWPAEELAAAAARAGSVAGVHLRGIGTNLACFAGVAPSVEIMQAFSNLVGDLEDRLGRALDLVSGGNSANLPWAEEASDTGRVNQLRIGEAILLGRETLRGEMLPGLRGDAFRVVAEVIESRAKPTAPPVAPGRDAFGNVPAFADRGVVERVVLALGRQDVQIDGLTPEVATRRVLGGSSDHLVVETRDEHLAVGTEMGFTPNYAALLAAMTSGYVHKQRAPNEAGEAGISLVHLTGARGV